MKTLLKKGISLLLCAGLAGSLSGCSLIKNIKENAARESETVIAESPEARDAVAVYNAALHNALQSCEDIDSEVRFNVRDARALSPADDNALTLLNAASKQLTGLIMSENPGSESANLSPDDTAGTLLREIDAEALPGLVIDRNYASEKVTDEKGNEVKDENGDTETVRYINDNLMTLSFDYFTDTVIREASTDAEGNEEEAVTERTPAGDDVIERVFGEKRDKAAILAEFEAVKDYLQIKDYTITYTDCSVKSEIDLDANLLQYVRFEKNMEVSAAVTGVGALAAMGDFTVVFRVNEETSYNFNYAIVQP